MNVPKKANVDYVDPYEPYSMALIHSQGLKASDHALRKSCRRATELPERGNL